MALSLDSGGLMSKQKILITAGLLIASLNGLSAAEQASGSAMASDTEARIVFNEYCVKCHNDRLKTAGVSFEGVVLSGLDISSELLEKAVRKLRLGSMPPNGNPRPGQATYTALTGWLETELDKNASNQPNPGRTESLHRLNRNEYSNAIRDLLDLEGLDYSTLLPGDDASYGFDNIAGVLGMTPTHLDRYLAAARTVSQIAVGDVKLPPSGETHSVPPDLSQDDRFSELPFGTRGGMLVHRYFPVDAEYVIRFQAFTGIGDSEDEPNFIELSIDGDRILFEEMDQKPVRHTQTGADIQANTDWEIRTKIKAGLRDVAVTFVKTTSGQLEDFLKPYLRPPGISSFRLTRMGGNSGPYIGKISFTGPFNTTGPGDTPSRRRVFVCKPIDAVEEEPCAQEILSILAKRAYRRPLMEEDLTDLFEFYRRGRTQGNFETGIQIALERLLASPDFLFRVVQDPSGLNAGDVYRISDVELASRMSFFLWSSIPDNELLELAIRGELSDPVVLEQQTRRLLADPRSKALVQNFAGQWLRLRNVHGTDPNAQMFPNFDENLRLAMRSETELLFENIVQEDRRVLDLLDADYTFVNERLARHYKIPNVYGSHFRRVPVSDENRRGLLGHASILTVTSQSNRTSPVTRGKWVLENLLGAPPPTPPANVPSLEETKVEGTLRQQMEQHRKNPVCAACHEVMDPLGFALENFNPLGQWRTKDAGMPVDAAGQMPDGVPFDGVVGLRSALLAKSDVFVSTLTEKLLIYALGRGLESYDTPAVRRISKPTAAELTFSELILGIINSVPFQMRMVTETSQPVIANLLQK